MKFVKEVVSRHLCRCYYRNVMVRVIKFWKMF